MQRPSRFGLNDRMSRVLAAASLSVWLLHAAAVVAFVIPRLGTLAFLRLSYSAEFGVSWVGDWRYIFLFPGLAGLALFADALLAGIVGRDVRAYGQGVWIATLLIQMGFAVGGGIALLLNA